MESKVPLIWQQSCSVFTAYLLIVNPPAASPLTLAMLIQHNRTFVGDLFGHMSRFHKWRMPEESSKCRFSSRLVQK